MPTTTKIMRGRVKWFAADKGYGFISAEGLPHDVFVHYSEITGNGYKKLEDNQEVEFQLSRTDKGLQAISVTAL